MTVLHNGILFSYNYCTILGLIHYHYGEISTKVTGLCTHSTDEQRKWKNISNLLFRRIRCSRSKPTYEITMRPFCWSSWSNPIPGNTAAKPRTNRKRRTWWCTTVHQVILFVNVPPRNNGQHETVQRSPFCKSHFKIKSLCIQIVYTTFKK